MMRVCRVLSAPRSLTAADYTHLLSVGVGMLSSGNRCGGVDLDIQPATQTKARNPYVEFCSKNRTHPEVRAARSGSQRMKVFAALYRKHLRK